MAELKRSIGLLQGTGMMLSIVLGAGLLALPGLAAQSAGAAALTIWVICAAVSVPLLCVFAIIGRDHPDAGGIAAVAKKAFGIRGYAVSTLLFLGAVAVGLPSIALVGGQYAEAAFGVPAFVAAMCLITCAMAMNLFSTKFVNLMSSTLSLAVVTVLIGLAVFGWRAIEPGLEHVTAVQLPDMAIFGATFMMVFFAFTGWEVASNLAGEFRNARRDFPLAMALSFIVAVLFYLCLAIIVLAAGPPAAIEAPFTAIMLSGYGTWAEQFVAAVAILLIFANLSAALWAVSRMVYSASDEGLLPRRLSALRDGVPIWAVTMTAFVLLAVTLLAGFGILHLSDLLAAAGMNFLLLYAGGAAALGKLSQKRTHRFLSFGSLAIVAVLVYGRGFEHLIYPGCLAVVALATTLKTPKTSRKEAASMVTGQA